MNKKIIAASIISLLIGVGLGFYATSSAYRSQSNQLESKGSEIDLANRINENIIERTTNIVAVNDDDEGTLGTLTVELTPGNGEIFSRTEPLIGFDFQDAQINAVKAAANYTNLPRDEETEGITNMNTHFTVSAKTSENVAISRIDGPSAGATAALTTVAALNDENIRKDAVMSGTISPDGSIGSVGDIMEKAKAAEAAGMNLFLVPEGQTVQINEERQPISHLKSYATEQGWDLEIKEVSNIKEATNYFYKQEYQKPKKETVSYQFSPQ